MMCGAERDDGHYMISAYVMVVVMSLRVGRVGREDD